jgi:hypothetical protein
VETRRLRPENGKAKSWVPRAGLKHTKKTPPKRA